MNPPVMATYRVEPDLQASFGSCWRGAGDRLPRSFCTIRPLAPLSTALATGLRDLQDQV